MVLRFFAATEMSATVSDFPLRETDRLMPPVAVNGPKSERVIARTRRERTLSNDDGAASGSLTLSRY